MALAEKYLTNLDGSWPDDLRKYARNLKRLKLQGEDAKTRDSLVSYAKIKAEAMEKRSAGDIPEALRLEHNCEVVYNELPSYAKW